MCLSQLSPHVSEVQGLWGTRVVRYKGSEKHLFRTTRISIVTTWDLWFRGRTNIRKLVSQLSLSENVVQGEPWGLLARGLLYVSISVALIVVRMVSIFPRNNFFWRSRHFERKWNDSPFKGKQNYSSQIFHVGMNTNKPALLVHDRTLQAETLTCWLFIECIYWFKESLKDIYKSRFVSFNPNCLSIVSEQYKSFKIHQLPLLSRELGS